MNRFTYLNAEPKLLSEGGDPLACEIESPKLVYVGKIINLEPIEGVVIRSQHNYPSAPISFKVINLGFEK